jgi:MoaA/NifB/PqqE/SkfB family radical SAM enzyme
LTNGNKNGGRECINIMSKIHNHPFFLRKGVNLDSTHRCALECPKCMRQLHYRNHGETVPGQDLSDKDFEKILQHMKHIDFEGTYSDPVHHPRFIHFLKRIYETGKYAEIHNASSTKSLDWYIKAWKANPNAQWVFSIDGLPKDSHKYRINQDGVKLFNIMKKSVEYLNHKPTWQYIIFKYNENDIDEAISLAKSINVNFYTVKSSRWTDEEDPYMPNNIQNRLF